MTARVMLPLWRAPVERAPVGSRYSAIAGALLGYWLLAVALQVAAGAYSSGFGTVSDESAHYVTGLMVRDYIAAGFPRDPLAFAQQYYAHYPKVALGQWPPVFYLIQAAWTLPFGIQLPVVLGGMASLTAAIATVVHIVIARSSGNMLAVAGAVLTISTPLVQQYTAAVMTEIPVALFCLGATVSFGWYIDTGRRGALFAFSTLAVLAILTKGNGLMLALVPPLAILMSRRWDLLRRAELWLAGIAVGAICTPWYLLTTKMVSASWVGGSPSPAYAVEAIGAHVILLWESAGPLLLIAAALGTFFSLRWSRRQGVALSLVALIVAAISLHSAIPSSLGARNLVTVIPPLIVLAVIGISRTASLWSARPVIGLIAVAIFSGLVMVQQWEPARKDWHGYQQAADHLLAGTVSAGAILVSADSVGEGMLVAEVAMRDKSRPRQVVLRAQKVLASSDWLGRSYQQFFHDRDELRAYLEAMPVRAIVIDTSLTAVTPDRFNPLLDQVVSTGQQSWKAVAVFDVVRGGALHSGALTVYERITSLPDRVEPVSFAEATGRRRFTLDR